MSDRAFDAMNPLRRWLTQAPLPVLVLYAIGTSFAVYFCMYAYRKPFDAVSFNDRLYLGTWINLKTVCVTGQIVGYMISKYLGAKFCSEVSAGRRAGLLIALILVSEAGLLLFAVVPEGFQPAAMFLNGVPLGMVWGLVVRYLEGRRTSEMLLAGLSCSFIIAGAVTRDIGRELVIKEWGISESWMPFVTGGLFFLPFVAAVVLLDQLPPPDEADLAARAARPDMGPEDRRNFLALFGPCLVPLLTAYFFLTAYRDFRDHYAAELFQTLQLDGDRAIFSHTEKWALLGSLIVMASLNLIGDHRRALLAAYGVIVAGFLLIGAATWAFHADALSGFWWMALVGLGMNLAYVPYGAILFERMVSATRFVGTSVFAIQFADGIGYTGSVLIQIYRDLLHGSQDRLTFFVPFSFALSIGGAVLMVISALLIVRILHQRALGLEPADQEPAASALAKGPSECTKHPTT